MLLRKWDEEDNEGQHYAINHDIIINRKYVSSVTLVSFQIIQIIQISVSKSLYILFFAQVAYNAVTDICVLSKSLRYTIFY